MTPPTASRAQILAFRLAAQGITSRASDPGTAFDGWAVQDSPPGAAHAAALARSTADLGPSWLDDAIAGRSVIAFYNPRSATSILPPSTAARSAATTSTRSCASVCRARCSRGATAAGRTTRAADCS